MLSRLRIPDADLLSQTRAAFPVGQLMTIGPLRTPASDRSKSATEFDYAATGQRIMSRDISAASIVHDHVIYVVEDETATREAVCDLLLSAGFHAEGFASASEYLLHKPTDVPECVLLDIGLPDINGLELQARLATADHPPIVFLTGCADVPSTVVAMRRGALDVLTKPFNERELIAAVGAALNKDRERRAHQEERSTLKARLALLTPRELEVMRLVIGGLMNKQAAAELGIREVTLQVHRGRVMQKMQATSLAELVRMAERLDITPSATRHAPRQSV